MVEKVINLKIPKGTKCKNGICEQDLDLDVSVDIPEVEIPKLQSNVVSGNQGQQLQQMQQQEPKVIEKEVEKIVEKVKAPKDQPFFKCKDCGGKHDNPNYSEIPKYKCPNCGTLNGQKNCKNCAKTTDEDDWDELDDDELQELEVPLPEKPNNHEHDHTHEEE